MFSKCIFAAITLAFVALAIAEDAVSESSTKDKHEKFLFNSTTQKNLTVFTFDVKTINVRLNDEKSVTTFDSIDLKFNSTMTPVDQDGNETHQDYTLTLSETYSFDFTFLGDGDTYNLSMIDFYQNKSSTLEIYRIDAPDLKLSKNTLKRETQGYKCGSLKLTFKKDDDSSNSTAEIEFVDISFVAFQNSDHFEKPSFLECRQAPGSSVIPLAVGGGLLVFMGIALVVYIFMRNRSG